jgi:hypothetical protein
MGVGGGIVDIDRVGVREVDGEGVEGHVGGTADDKWGEGNWIGRTGRRQEESWQDMVNQVI